MTPSAIQSIRCYVLSPWTVSEIIKNEMLLNCSSANTSRVWNIYAIHIEMSVLQWQILAVISAILTSCQLIKFRSLSPRYLVFEIGLSSFVYFKQMIRKYELFFLNDLKMLTISSRTSKHFLTVVFYLNNWRRKSVFSLLI